MIEFKVGNFLSFRKTAILRMAPVLDNDGPGTRFGDPTDMMFIYGPNSAGKSNLLKAMAFSRDLALNGYSKIDAGRYHGEKGPSYFEYVVSIKGTTYSYGFEVILETMERCSEWLYILDPEGDRCIFEYEGEGSHTVKGKKSMICPLEMIRPSMLDCYNFMMVRDWLQNSLLIEGSRMRDEIIPASDDFLEILSNGLRETDTGITEVRAEEFRNKEIPVNLLRRMPDNNKLEHDGKYLAIVTGNEMKRSWFILIERDGDKISYKNLTFVHEDYVPLNANCESLGTFRIIQTLALISNLKRNSKNNGLIVTDELECSVHTLVVTKIVDLFREHAHGKGQLLTTTHKAYILSNSQLDERNFSFIDMDRSTGYGSKLYTMSSVDQKFKDRRRAYFDGRMFAIPFFNEDQI